MKSIDDFLQTGRYATVGIDPADRSFGRTHLEKLRRGDREVFVVLTYGDRAASAGETVYTSVAEVPGGLDAVVLNIENDPDRMLRETQAAVEKGVSRIWIENRCDADAAVQYAREHGVWVVDNVCSLLALESSGIHKCHRWILDLFRKTPQPTAPAG